MGPFMLHCDTERTSRHTCPRRLASVSERRCDRFRRLLPTGERADHRGAELSQMHAAFSVALGIALYSLRRPEDNLIPAINGVLATFEQPWRLVPVSS
jgi:hypothetical protein